MINLVQIHTCMIYTYINVVEGMDVFVHGSMIYTAHWIECECVHRETHRMDGQARSTDQKPKPQHPTNQLPHTPQPQTFPLKPPKTNQTNTNNTNTRSTPSAPARARPKQPGVRQALPSAAAC
jgi:hypothetical protein